MTDRVRLIRAHYLNGELKRPGTVLALKAATCRELVSRKIAVAAQKPASPAARNQK